MTHVPDDVVSGFARLFRGYPHAYGTGKGGWVHSAPNIGTYKAHLEGKGESLGIGPLLPDDTCYFAAIDLDKPDFDLAKQMMELLPGVSWLERSRSGNAHVLVFFKTPIEAWVARGILREALAALNQRGVEIFPKTDHLLPGMVGNYLNLPFFGDTRPVVGYKQVQEAYDDVVPLAQFVTLANRHRNEPDEWRKRARWLGLASPEERKEARVNNFGESPTLHICAQYLIEHRDDNPVLAGHRAAVYFALSKMLANWSEIDNDEALGMMALVNDASPDPIPSDELDRIYRNAVRGEFTSTGCDDPLFLPYRHPKCKIGA